MPTHSLFTIGCSQVLEHRKLISYKKMLILEHLYFDFFRNRWRFLPPPELLLPSQALPQKNNDIQNRTAKKIRVLSCKLDSLSCQPVKEKQNYLHGIVCMRLLSKSLECHNGSSDRKPYDKTYKKLIVDTMQKYFLTNNMPTNITNKLKQPRSTKIFVSITSFRNSMQN